MLKLSFLGIRIALIMNLRLTEKPIMAIMIRPKALSPRSHDSSVSWMIGREPSLFDRQSIDGGGSDWVGISRE
jgi:hypothetical protein